MTNLSGSRVLYAKSTIFMPLPRELWRSYGPCNCSVCKGSEGYWDTLAIARKPNSINTDHAWMVHMPEAQR